MSLLQFFLFCNPFGGFMNKKIIVDREMKIYDFLREKLLSLSKNNIKSILRRKMVMINNEIVTSYDYNVKINDVVIIKNNVIESNFSKEIKIIYEDKSIIVIDKPSGILTIATEENKYDNFNLYSILSKYVKKENANNKIFIVHRLDKDTSGVIIFAKSENIKEKLQKNWNETTNRIYYAVVIGNTKEKNTLMNYLQEDKRLRTYVSDSGKLAITNYEKIKSNSKYSLLKIKINSGRRNQIRVQLSNINHPILGDNKYGIKDKSAKRMMLHASILEIVNPISNKKMKFESKVPSLFYKKVE